MSDAATAAGSDSGAGASHVCTAEWQSFEVRMRRRRAQRCLLRAEVAAEAGVLDDAQDALDEATRLGAASDEIARIEQLIATAREPKKVNRRSPLRWVLVATGTAIVVAAAAFASGTLLRDAGKEAAPQAAEPAVQAEPLAAAEPPSVAVSVQNVRAASIEGLPLDTVATTGVENPVPDPAETPATLQAAAREQIKEGELPDRGGGGSAPIAREEPPQISVASPSSVPLARLLAPAPPPLAPPPVELAPAEASPASASITPNVEPVPNLNAPAVRDESAAVRAVLARYERAYSQLDPLQARAVWPTVDERGLSRAFSGLASQHVSLGRCEIALNGVIARATCAGSATWTPKVGGGARTESRRWTFDLRKSGETWRIERALTR